MKNTTIACALLATCLCTSLLADKVTYRGWVTDLYGNKVKDLSINVKGASYYYPGNRFLINVDKGDTLKFELDGVILKRHRFERYIGY
jgi:hypothetical protein